MFKRKTVSQETLYLFIPYKVAKVAAFISRDEHIPITEAMSRFYKSATYKELEDESTKLWHYGPVALYQEYQINH